MTKHVVVHVRVRCAGNNDRARGVHPGGPGPERARAGQVPRHGHPDRGRGPRHRRRPRGTYSSTQYSLYTYYSITFSNAGRWGRFGSGSIHAAATVDLLSHDPRMNESWWWWYWPCRHAMQVLTASVPKEVSHLTTLMSMGGSGGGDLRSAADAHELRAACS